MSSSSPVRDPETPNGNKTPSRSSKSQLLYIKCFTYAKF